MSQAMQADRLAVTPQRGIGPAVTRPAEGRSAMVLVDKIIRMVPSACQRFCDFGPEPRVLNVSFAPLEAAGRIQRGDGRLRGAVIRTWLAERGFLGLQFADYRCMIRLGVRAGPSRTGSGVGDVPPTRRRFFFCARGRLARRVAGGVADRVVERRPKSLLVPAERSRGTEPRIVR